MDIVYMMILAQAWGFYKNEIVVMSSKLWYDYVILKNKIYYGVLIGHIM